MSNPYKTIKFNKLEVAGSTDSVVQVTEEDGELNFLEFESNRSSGKLRIRNLDELLEVGSTILWAIGLGIDQGWIEDLDKSEVGSWVM